MKKAILDDEDVIIGIGDTTAEAQSDAVRTINYDHGYIVALVEGMTVRDISDTLAAKIELLGSDDVETVEVVSDGKRLLVTSEEAAALQDGAK
jgi:hypothetical protein